jgi:protein-tyrosine-phosphatase
MDTALSSSAPGLFKLLAHDLRWRMVMLLSRSDYRVQELVALLKHPQNLISYHLRLLAEQNVVAERRNSADERSIYYSLNFATVDHLYRASGEAVHPALSRTYSLDDVLQEAVAKLLDPSPRVLFLCTHNSARSQMAEGILRSLSKEKVEVASAGSHPAPIHPLAIQACDWLGIDISHQRSKHLDELHGQSFDYIVTVCDYVREACPTWPGDPERVHWSFADPAKVEGSEEQRARTFQQTAMQLLTRLRYFLIVIAREKRAMSRSIGQNPSSSEKME